jgi:hypothetical protein
VKLTTVVILMVGGTLVYSAIKDKSPLDVLKMGLQGKAAPTKAPKPTNQSSAVPLPTTPTAPQHPIVSV